MKKIIATTVFSILLSCSTTMAAEDHPPYQYPKQAEVMKTLQEWQDWKFGLFIHWGTYSQWGIVESWSLCPEDRSFTSVRPHDKSYFEYVKEYENLKTTFNPGKFNPSKWADAAKDAGMKYVVFTTKHHDGFNMYDTKFTDYKITDKDCPYSQNKNADITKALFDAFRVKGLKTGAYYSISDWHCNDYWWDYFPPQGRFINYSIQKYPDRWKRLNDFIDNQLNELTSKYGKLEMLWFDLCDVSNEGAVDWPRFEKTIRGNQPGAMMVARHQYNICENYRTPEQKIPEKALDYPWETCMTMADQWSYKPNDNYKSTYQIIQFLVQIVSRGGNFLLNVGPGPDGEIDPTAYQRLKEIGKWMKVNGEAIYETKPIEPYKETKLAFTAKENQVYAFYLPIENEKKIPAKVAIETICPVKGSEVYLLGYNKPLKWEPNGKGVIIDIPESLQKNPPCEHAWAFKFKMK